MLSRTNIKNSAKTLKEANWLKVLLFSAIFIIGSLYIWQVNVSATRGFAMRDLDREIEILKTQNDRLQMDVAKLQSIDSVTTRSQMLGLVKIDVIDYVNATSSVAFVNDN